MCRKERDEPCGQVATDDRMDPVECALLKSVPDGQQLIDDGQRRTGVSMTLLIPENSTI